KRAKDNKSLGQFNLDGIQPAPRGMPQIEVTFDIDADGILHVSAKDKNTGKEQKIAIKASSGLNEEEIKKMISDAEANTETDRKFEELIQTRNQGDQISHSVKKQLSENQDKLDEKNKKEIQKSLDELDQALQKEDKSEIENKIQKVLEISSKFMEKNQKKPQTNQPNTNHDSPNKNTENVVDAEFEEIKD
ncbi:Hsp70 family protein, partial [Buchnera aphidicola (Pemphigus obesinymphae)]|uniref:Hsp70 family protein n=1 Tax=Buchnera aphidicola TaxID=9 RepID=UPI002237850A